MSSPKLSPRTRTAAARREEPSLPSGTASPDAPPPSPGDGQPSGAAPEGEPPYRVTEQVGYLLRRAHQRASALFQEHFSGIDLTPTQFAALSVLVDEGELSQNLLGRVTAMDPATIQGVVMRLRDRGLVERVADHTDRRRFMVRPTAAGRAIATGAIAEARAVTAATLAPLKPAERKTFLALLRRLG
ncbi:MarR family winged helix-turn-helix transcriptional regulator [Arenibaculum pallidiluteum]|uniref:MarR family winged helix-turn-helix transcriptional regulator n=1 Tax=Arenibaculum pallidiluteum TaxID=2812559 RepID=UPI001A975263|nr:MarR family winged helix-turn-helix transcriptional regulator [Arenibaculum pallidiluteum]